MIKILHGFAAALHMIYHRHHRISRFFRQSAFILRHCIREVCARERLTAKNNNKKNDYGYRNDKREETKKL